ncbi:hypothetical protein M1247_03070 [Mycobacterium sp. 21AC1]|uniref:hypothetical protein n=1 Tax=[Mycobacterium] appelbergii TaxID=2939269 RepID=UPI002938FCBB|nr:hypothetical protein [Mycobacterium sp. 21AC1]MDV3123887.1 hypothetical protein [Mycobacterium sp. 21AC1]
MRTAATMVKGRSPWMNDRVATLCRLLDDHHGFRVPKELARAAVADHLDLLASIFRIPRQGAYRYVTDEVLRDMAREMAAELHGRSGRD